MTTIAILGAGKIGEAMLAGLLAAGRSPGSLLFTERDPARVAQLTERYGVRGVETDEAATVADVVIVAVKPQDIDPLLQSLAASITPGTLVVSLCAGLPTSLYERNLPAGTPVVRVMPNTPMLVGEAMSAISAGSHAGPEDLQLVEDLLSTVGKVVRVPENQQDAVTALSGSGPAYFFFLVEAMIDAGILLGLPRAVSTELIIQSAVGAATMLRDSGEHPVTLREAVTSPGGTTIAAIRELENHRVRAALLTAIEAAALRSAELGKAHHGA
jgi:pyrroline-5-carboxylate reductase